VSRDVFIALVLLLAFAAVIYFTTANPMH